MSSDAPPSGESSSHESSNVSSHEGTPPPSEEEPSGDPAPISSEESPREGSLISRFLNQLQSNSTRRVYRKGLEYFFEDFLGEEEVSLETARRTDRDDILFFLHHRMKSRSENTVRTRATALRSFFLWLREEGHLGEIPVRKEGGSSRLVQAARADRNPPKLEDFPSEFFEPGSWIEGSLDQSLPEELDLLRGLVLPLYKIPAAADVTLAYFWRWYRGNHDAEEVPDPRTHFLRIEHENRLLAATLKLDPESVYVEARVEEETLMRLRKEGPGQAFGNRSVLEALAFLHHREWRLPGPLFEQLQRMSSTELEPNKPEDLMLEVPDKSWCATDDLGPNTPLRKPAVKEVGAVLAGAFDVAAGERFETLLQQYHRPGDILNRVGTIEAPFSSWISDENDKS